MTGSNDSEVEQFLARHDFVAPSAAARDKIEKTVRARYLPIIRPLAVAALLLIASGLIQWSNLQNRASQQDNTILIDEESPSAKMFLFVRAEHLDTGQPVAVLHEMQEFEIVRRKQGENIFDQTVLDVKVNGLDVRDPDGLASFLSKDYLQKQFADAVHREVKAMRDQINDGNISDKHFARLENYALMGQRSALTLMDQIAKSDSAYAKQAGKNIGHLKETAYLRALIEKVQDPATANRKFLLKSLEAIQNPYVLSGLREIVSNNAESEAVRILAVETMAKFKDAYTANAFEAIAMDTGIPDNIRKLVLEKRNEILDLLETRKN
ncbi:hypothetical protein ACFL54_00255 [Planctomycetota bacterium]